MGSDRQEMAGLSTYCLIRVEMEEVDFILAFAEKGNKIET